MQSFETLKNSPRAWLLAIRPKTLSTGTVPILVGALITKLSFYELNWGILLSALLAVISITISTNLINDALDSKKGADTKARLGPLRVSHNGILNTKDVLAVGFGFLLLTAAFFIPLLIQGGMPIGIVLVASLVCSYLYTGGPYPLSYNGLGEVFVLIFYGLIATLASYYLQMGNINLDAVIAALQIGFLAMLIIGINNLRDIKEDSTTGKKTVVVRYGLKFGKIQIAVYAFAPFIFSLYWFFTSRFLAFVLPFASIFIALNIVKGIWKTKPSRLYNRYFGEAALLLLLFGILLILGIRL